MTKQKKQRLEQEKIKEWKAKGFSDEQIINKLNEYRKNRKRKAIIKGVVSAFAGVVVVAGATVAVPKIVGLIMSGQTQNLTPEQQKEAERIKNEEEKLFEDIENDVPDKNPEDIVIPDDATEEEKEKLQEEQEYWGVVQQTKENVKNMIISNVEQMSANPDEYIPAYLKNFQNVRRINNFYMNSNNQLVVDCDIIYSEKYGDDTYTRQTNLILCCSEEINKIDCLSDLTNYLTTNKEFEILKQVQSVEVNVDAMNDFYENHIKNTVDSLIYYNNKGAEITSLKTLCYEFSGNAPVKYQNVSQVKLGENTFYILSEITSTTKTQNMSMEEWEQFARDAEDNTGIRIKDEIILQKTDLDWKALSEEYSGQQSSQEEEQTAEAASFETTNEQGEVDGFDWNAYRARVQQKEEEEQKNYAQQNVVDTAKVLYDDFELGL
ncbi:MAG: hypothetical protein ACI4T2_02435 [Christensenellales bacterium]